MFNISFFIRFGLNKPLSIQRTVMSMVSDCFQNYEELKFDRKCLHTAMFYRQKTFFSKTFIGGGGGNPLLMSLLLGLAEFNNYGNH
jgi:hypothetical protein